MTILYRIFNWFKKDKKRKWETKMDDTPRHGRRLKVTQRKGVAIYEKIKTDPRQPLVKEKSEFKKPAKGGSVVPSLSRKSAPRKKIKGENK
jgi:hypothetical protein